jgi:hypothetical protein
MRRRLSYANVAATLALVFAMSGGALAASHYLINSTRQINPKVLKKLKGARGARGGTGAAGPRGATGAGGPPGKDGAPGKDGSPGTSAAASVPSAFAQVKLLTALPLEEAETLVLQTKTSGKNLVLATAGAHVLAQASVQIENLEVSKVEVTCQLAWEGLAGGGSHPFGEPSTVDLEGSFVAHAEIPLTATVSLLGGESYNLQVFCHVGNFEGKHAAALGGAINALAPG